MSCKHKLAYIKEEDPSDAMWCPICVRYVHIGEVLERRTEEIDELWEAIQELRKLLLPV